MDSENAALGDGLGGLELQSLDPESLFQALTSVERAVPALLNCVKPILARLAAPTANTDTSEASEAIERYMDLLDKIQFVLRQTVYYLSETSTSSNILIPPPVGSVPTPFASTLPPARSSTVPSSDDPKTGTGTVTDMGTDVKAGDESEEGEGVELGLYARRIEARTLGELADVLKRWGERRRREAGTSGGTGTDNDGGEMQDVT